MSTGKTDGAQLILALQKGCEALKTGQSLDDDLLQKAKTVKDSSDACFAVKKLAAELLYRSERQRSGWLGLAAALDVDGSRVLIPLTRKWLSSYGQNSQICSSMNEFIFYSGFIQKVSRERKKIRTGLGDDEYRQLKRNLVFVTLTLSELKDENTTSLFKALVKLNESDKETVEMAYLCQEMGIYLPGNLLLISFLSKEAKIPFFDEYLASLPVLAAEQELASSSSPLVAELLKLSKEETIEKIVSLLVSKNGALVANVFRCWLSRWVNLSTGHEALFLILAKLENLLEEQLSRPRTPYFPMSANNYEDFTCIDPFWEWQESSGVSWPEDRLLSAFVKVMEIFLEKFSTKKTEQYKKGMISKIELIKTASSWHDEEIRQKASKLSKHLDLDPGKTVSAPSTVSKTDHNKVFTPEGLDVSAVSRNFEVLKFFADDLLKKHGSEKEGHVPSFPTVHKKLEELGLVDRAVVKQLTDSIERAIWLKEIDPREKAEFVFDIVTRTRMKAVVDSGCSALEALLGNDHFTACLYFPRLIDYLLDTKTEVRTLVLSRLLWSCCQESKTFFEELFTKVEVHLSLSTDASVLTRILKTLKLFVSQADCRFPSRAYSVLFSFCLEAQNSENFLVRSAATIVFGFLLRSITKPRKLPLFVLIGSQPDLWNQWRQSKLHSLSSLPRAQRILLLSLLKQYIVAHPEFYSDKEIGTIGSLLNEVNKTRIQTPDIRERRFCIDVLVQLTPTSAHANLSEILGQETNSLNKKEDLKYLHYRLNLLHFGQNPNSDADSEAEKVVTASEYYKIQKEVSTSENGVEKLDRLLKSTDANNELAAQNLVIALETIVWKNESNFDGSQDIFLKLCGSEFERVRSLASRIPVAAKKEQFYKNISL